MQPDLRAERVYGLIHALLQIDDALGVAGAAVAARDRGWAAVELAVALLLIAAGLQGYVPYTSTPWLLLVAWVFLWRRGPGWRGVGLRRPTSWWSALAVGAAIGIAYQLVGLYLIEPLIARITGALPDVSMFSSMVGDERRLVFWLGMSWTLAALGEELVFRGYLMNRLAELFGGTRGAWMIALVVSSALFGLVHLYQGWSGVVATGLMGLTFALAYLASGRNLWSAILAHGISDTLGFTMIYLGTYPGL